MRTLVHAVTYILLACAAAGCHNPPLNPTPPQSEDQVLANPLQLTRGFQRAGEAYFSPDMRWIIFQAAMTPDDPYSMYLAQLKWQGDDITGINTPIRISPPGSWNSCGYFSPDGNSLIFSSTRKPYEKPPRAPTTQYTWDIPRAGDEIYRADGWKGLIAALPPGANTDLAKHAITNHNAYSAECAFSPDGKWIVYSSTASGDQELWAIRADGAMPVQLTHTPGNDGGPFFSPDGKRITYRSDRKGNGNLQVYVADLVFNAGGDITAIANEKRLTNEDAGLKWDNAMNWAPYWHPDNRHLVWSTSVLGQRNFELYLMRDDGSRKTRITFTENSDVLPVFSPDGKWLMWTSRRGEDKSSQIWIARFSMPKGA
jgi:Tol biopolymer transport system component